VSSRFLTNRPAPVFLVSLELAAHRRCVSVIGVMRLLAIPLELDVRPGSLKGPAETETELRRNSAKMAFAHTPAPWSSTV
jgi:hypothetical protein